ncbi:succinate dehydrogenase, hydrophobic membrane anchor protein [Acuticoccus mangrovi]|uniref:Succinate dehydrogenase hydrophobic membrane anchor subunit n=1 Tax=Acuticoccus mangrovi TaxID=2796142 RepID=A0A934IMS6_9HYPH|nr:succinate dehydrogenase, hydrophobic membrane anchor protein [Acuticoccus mangrovi]MBJ3775253.1 succinate dehydrogenase, hydrophobic membrane anchor protein [Acuticoccus mangrovi]
MRDPRDNSDGFSAPHRTSLKTIRGLGSARSGTEHFIQQRFTALANFVLVIVLAFVAIAMSGRSYTEAVALIGSPWVAVPLALAIISVCLHMKIGVQVVVEDYVHGLAGLTLLILNAVFAALVGGAALFAVVKILLAALSVQVAE